MSLTAKLPTDRYGQCYFGSKTAADAADDILFELGGSYATDNLGQPLSRAQMLSHLRAQKVKQMKDAGYTKSASKIEFATEEQLRAMIK